MRKIVLEDFFLENNLSFEHWLDLFAEEEEIQTTKRKLLEKKIFKKIVSSYKIEFSLLLIWCIDSPSNLIRIIPNADIWDETGFDLYKIERISEEIEQKWASFCVNRGISLDDKATKNNFSLRRTGRKTGLNRPHVIRKKVLRMNNFFNFKKYRKKGNL